MIIYLLYFKLLLFEIKKAAIVEVVCRQATRDVLRLPERCDCWGRRKHGVICGRKQANDGTSSMHAFGSDVGSGGGMSAKGTPGPRSVNTESPKCIDDRAAVVCGLIVIVTRLLFRTLSYTFYFLIRVDLFWCDSCDWCCEVLCLHHLTSSWLTASLRG